MSVTPLPGPSPAAAGLLEEQAALATPSPTTSRDIISEDNDNDADMETGSAHDDGVRQEAQRLGNEERHDSVSLDKEKSTGLSDNGSTIVELGTASNHAADTSHEAREQRYHQGVDVFRVCSNTHVRQAMDEHDRCANQPSMGQQSFCYQ